MILLSEALKKRRSSNKEEPLLDMGWNIQLQESPQLLTGIRIIAGLIDVLVLTCCII